ncbi:NADH-quinone oxidoreductase subunit NuoF [Candidatus Skiveiella danica]|uniref:NADH-quinone oxidoreductase subunit NuoF n=1 Tax=Candidatus Skiveiella danica TaxID=3386177 RepID=UPI0039B92C34
MATSSAVAIRRWKILAEKIPQDQVIGEVKKSGTARTGGAVSDRLEVELHAAGHFRATSTLSVTDEGEPGTFKDRDILRYNPHSVIEGMVIAAYAMGAKRATTTSMARSAKSTKDLKRRWTRPARPACWARTFWAPASISSFFAHHGYGAYICGEETALLESLEGKKGQPRFKPPFPANYGLYGKPTTINNTETFGAIPFIINLVRRGYLEPGKPNNGGTKLFSISGHVNKPGNYEIPLGTPFSPLLEMAGGMRGGKKLKAVIPGGSSAPVLPGEIMMDLTMDYDSIAKAGSMLGSGAVIVMNEDICMVKALERLAYFYHEESCGQCTPCREGTGWLYRVIHRIENGLGRPGDLELLDSVGNNMAGRTICALADAAVFPVRSFTKHFRNEFEYHIEHKKCLVNHKWC